MGDAEDFVVALLKERTITGKVVIFVQSKRSCQQLALRLKEMRHLEVCVRGRGWLIRRWMGGWMEVWMDGSMATYTSHTHPYTSLHAVPGVGVPRWLDAGGARHVLRRVHPGPPQRAWFACVCVCASASVATCDLWWWWSRCPCHGRCRRVAGPLSAREGATSTHTHTRPTPIKTPHTPPTLGARGHGPPLARHRRGGHRLGHQLRHALPAPRGALGRGGERDGHGGASIESRLASSLFALQQSFVVVLVVPPSSSLSVC